MRCSKCGFENPDGMKFCGQCTAPLALVCPKCHFENPPGFKFCGQCTAALGPAAAEPEPSGPSLTLRESDDAAAMEGERKTVTALFADIKGSTELEEDLDPEEARAIIDPALKLMIDAVSRYDGYVVQSTGDGIFALFGAPLAHEDHPQRALYAALRMQDDVRRFGDRLRAEGRAPLQIRIGANTGEVVVRSIRTGEGKSEYTPIGHTTNLASRMQSLANPGSTVISESTRRMVEGYFALKPLGASRVKGIAAPVNVYEVTGLGPLRTRLQRAAGRGLTKFVGRQREMDAMKYAAEQATAGQGQIVAAVAEAGVGKSRLFHEFKATSASDWMVLEAFSVSHGKASAFLPVIDLLWGYFKITSDDDERTRREKITGKVLTLDRSLEDALPYLYGLLGLTDENNQIAEVEAQTRKRRSLEAVKRILQRESLNQPLMVIFEDLHWVDEESQGFLNLLADSIGTARVLLLVSYRPEYSHQWNSKTYYTQLRLDPLGKESADEMLSVLLGTSPAPDEGAAADIRALKRLIIERTEGNPFFIEETVQVLFDDGALVRNGLVKLRIPLRELKIAPTVQDILAARVDRLAPDQKDLLQTLAVIGVEFPLGLVQRVLRHPHPAGDAPSGLPRHAPSKSSGAGEAPDELEAMLSELQLGEFIYEHPAVGDIEYTFKHALTHDVAYHSVLNERRRVLHEQIGAALESIYAESLDNHVAELAHHYARSRNPGKAVEYCLRACQQCSERASHVEAVAHFETGLARLQELPDNDRRAELELDLRNAAYRAMVTIKGYASLEAAQSAARAMVLCQRPGINWEKTWSALEAVQFFHHNRPDLRKAWEIGAELIARAEEHGSAEHVAYAETFLAWAKMISGDFELAAQGFDRAWALLGSITKPATGFTQQRAALMPQARRIQPFPRLEFQAPNRGFSARNLWFLGYPDRALERLNIATGIAHESGSKVLLEQVHYNGVIIFELRRELERMRERAEASVAIATELGSVTPRARSEVYLGWADAIAGDLDGGIARMRHYRLELKAAGSEVYHDHFLALIATALGRLRRFDEALRTIDESFPIIERTGARWHEAGVHRLKGELLLAQDASNAAQAEQSFRTAIEISRRQKAKSWELRATTSLARLLAKQGRRDEARAMLWEIYNWFTEGFDTADLKDAKALLDELAA